MILAGTWSLLRDSLSLALDAVPPGVDIAAVEAYLTRLLGVVRVHDLLIWGMSTTETALTAHLVIPKGGDDALLAHTACELHDRFGIEHVTLQVERDDVAHSCRQASPEVV